jgi:hypothetical protein
MMPKRESRRFLLALGSSLAFVLTVGFAGSAFAQNAAGTDGAPDELTLEGAAPAPTPASAPAPAPAPTTSQEEAAPTVNESAPKNVFVMKSARDDEYTKPVFYDSMENLLPTMELEYDLSGDQGKSFRIGDVVINDKTFFVALLPVGKFHPRMATVAGAETANKMALVLRWPEALWSEGTLEVISRTGSVLWKERITEAKKNQWSQTLNEWLKGLQAAGVKTAQFPSTSAFGTVYGILSPEAKGFHPKDESFRFCLTQSKGRSRSSLCSQRYVMRQGTVMGLSKVRATAPARVLLAGENAPLSQTLPVSKTSPTSLYADLAGGESYEFVSLPNKLNLMDISSGAKSDELRVVGFGTRPTSPSVILNPDDYSGITRAIGFEATIGDMRKFWQTTVRSVNPKIYLPGVGGGIFVQRLDISEVPRANARPYLDARTPTGTYIDGVELSGQRLPEVKIGSIENGVTIDESDPRHFIWSFKATERGQMNRSYLNLDYEGHQYKAFYEIYKGFPREVSGRLSGLVSPTSGSVFLGEFAYNQWFEDVFGWNNYYLARQRWGLSAKYFKSITNLKVSSAGDEAAIAVGNVDLKYRLIPGLWNRDETIGAMVDYQSLVFEKVNAPKLNAPMLGVGAFWARSMPKVFDDLFNIFSLMRYPKWVDMEFIYYPVSMSSTATLRTNFALNFHGKVMWSKHWFGEAGFGMKRFDVVETQLQQAATLNTFYGTVGLGLSF